MRASLLRHRSHGQPQQACSTSTTVVLLPEEGRFEEFEDSLDADLTAEIVKDLAPDYIDLTMPKFSFRSRFRLNAVLCDMGMPSAFGGADFSGMGPTGLSIAHVFHQAFVAVDESGTEAAAATAVIIRESSPSGDMVIDRPFLFFIRDKETGSVLFVGRVLDPTA